jgi:hypothetical protein
VNPSSWTCFQTDLLSFAAALKKPSSFSKARRTLVLIEDLLPLGTAEIWITKASGEIDE